MREQLKIGEILVRAGVIDEMQLRAALGEQANWGQRLGVTLVKMGIVDELALVRALSEQLGIPLVQLEGKRVQREVLDLIPVELAEKHMAVPLFMKDESGVRKLFVGMENPVDLEAIDELTFRSGLEIKPVLVTPSELCEALDRFYHRADVPVHGQSAGTDATPVGQEAGGEVFADPQAKTGIAPIQESLFPEISGISEEIEGDCGITADFGWDSTEAEMTLVSGVQEGSTTSQSEGPPRYSLAAPAIENPPRSESESSEEVNTGAILQALCQLLIEKGVISREELRERLRELQARDGSESS